MPVHKESSKLELRSEGLAEPFFHCKQLAWRYEHVVQARTLRLADGPDDVHMASIAQEELGRVRKRMHAKL